MSVQKMMVNAVDADGKWLYRVGGISALVLLSFEKLMSAFAAFPRQSGSENT